MAILVEQAPADGVGGGSMDEDRDDDDRDGGPDDCVRLGSGDRLLLYTNVYAVLRGDMALDRAASQMDQEIQGALETF